MYHLHIVLLCSWSIISLLIPQRCIYFLFRKIWNDPYLCVFSMGPYGALHHLWSKLHSTFCFVLRMICLFDLYEICQTYERNWFIEQHTFCHIYPHFSFFTDLHRKVTQYSLLYLISFKSLSWITRHLKLLFIYRLRLTISSK